MIKEVTDPQHHEHCYVACDHCGHYCPESVTLDTDQWARDTAVYEATQAGWTIYMNGAVQRALCPCCDGEGPLSPTLDQRELATT